MLFGHYCLWHCSACQTVFSGDTSRYPRAITSARPRAFFKTSPSLAKRHREAVGHFSSLFGAIKNDSFAVKFSKSAGDNIESVAASHRELKDEELREINKNYAVLREQAAREEHVYQQQLDGTLFHTFNSCLKCYHQGLADSMDIRAHE